MFVRFMFAAFAMALSVAATNGALADETIVVRPADPAHAFGFGAASKGGTGGRELAVTSLDDDPKSPQPGTLRWAIEQEGPRIVRFRVAGSIRLRAPLEIRRPFLTIDGYDAPGLGICLCDHTLSVKETHNIIVRHIRVRRGDVTVLERNKRERVKRPKNSADLDCIAADDSTNLLFDHISASWCTDEVFSIVGCRNVTVQWCILSEPLTNPALHPYGDNHAFCLNTSAIDPHRSPLPLRALRHARAAVRSQRRPSRRRHSPAFRSREQRHVRLPALRLALHDRHRKPA
ncbi:MAG: hypothetical protein QM775_32060 [Pirellulales bacterium]